MKKFTNAGQFKKGFAPWNKGLVGTFKHTDEWKEKAKERMLGNKNHEWKGENVSYTGIHKWIDNCGGEKKECYICKQTENLEWANKSGQYIRDVNDWLCLCSACHDIYDKQIKLTKDQVVQLKNLYSKGTKQKELSKLFNISQACVSNIVNNKTKYSISYLNEYI